MRDEDKTYREKIRKHIKTILERLPSVRHTGDSEQSITIWHA